METSTIIRKMLAGNKIYVPTYQRAYSWDIEPQIKTFLSDLEDCKKNESSAPYYFGHFLFEEKSDDNYGIIDGQQRMTTIIIFLSAIFKRVKELRTLTDNEKETFEDIIKRNGTYRFKTVDYDSQFFNDYVIDQKKKDTNGIETTSAKRIANAFDFFNEQLKDKEEEHLQKLLKIVENATCTTHPVKNESEAIQMFIFQNNRGKKPSNLEIIKAQFMFNIHLFGGEDKSSLLEEIKNRFTKIYYSISSIESKIKEDDILTYTLRVHFNSLWENNALNKINECLEKDNRISFIQEFTHSLTASFDHLKQFFNKDEKENIKIHSFVTLGGFSVALPFIIKAYKFGLSINQIGELCDKFEDTTLRHRLIGTRADITSRLNEVYQEFTEENKIIEPIIDRIETLKIAEDYWSSHWNNNKLREALQGNVNRQIARFLLWKYENHLESLGKNGYELKRYDSIKEPELEHIAPETENLNSGYEKYDEDFINNYLNCLGNYLLLSKSHNCSVGNNPFKEKRESYKHSAQQLEIIEMTDDSNPIWTKEIIKKRNEKIINFILENI